MNSKQLLIHNKTLIIDIFLVLKLRTMKKIYENTNNKCHRLVSNKRKGLTEDDEVHIGFLMVTMIKVFNVHVACDVECDSQSSNSPNKYRIRN